MQAELGECPDRMLQWVSQMRAAACVLAVLLECNPAGAQTDHPAPGQPYCGMGSCLIRMPVAYGNFRGEVSGGCGTDTFLQDNTRADTATLGLDVPPDKIDRLGSDAFVGPLLDRIRSAARALCRKTVMAMWLRPGEDRSVLERYDVGTYNIDITSGSTLLVRASLPLKGGHFDNYAKGLIAQQHAAEQQRQATDVRRRAEVVAKLGRRTSFMNRFHVQVWTTADKLTANPFAFGSKVIGVKLTFSRMISATQALFTEGAATVAVAGVPSTQFTGGEEVVLALRARGTTSVASTPLPLATYIGAYQCTQSGCGDFFY
jgi:hypothetical protein